MNMLIPRALLLILSPVLAIAAPVAQTQTERDISRWLSCQQGDYAKSLKAFKAARAYGVHNGYDKPTPFSRLKSPVTVLGEQNVMISYVRFNAGQEELDWAWQTARPTHELLKLLGIKGAPLRDVDGSVKYSEWKELGGPDGVLINITSRPKQPTEVSCSYVRAW